MENNLFNVDGNNSIGNNSFSGNSITTNNIYNNNQNTENDSKYIGRLYEEHLANRDKEGYENSSIDWDGYDYAIDIIGLEKKLEDGNRNSMIGKALRWKEDFVKKVTKNFKSPESQEVMQRFLGKIEVDFEMNITPLINTNKSIKEVNDAITDKIITPIINELGENLFSLIEKHIWGMIFYLTGNCYIKWC